MLATGLMVRSIVARIPPAWEKDLGDKIMAELKEEMDLVEETNRVGALAELATPLLRVLPKNHTDYRFHIVEDPMPNAFALPGGHIIVTTSLLQMADGRAEEVLGVVAHEVAHVTQKHGFRQQIASYGPLLIFKMFLRGRSGSMGVFAGASALLVGQSYSQEFEMEADEVGWQYLVDANIDPRGMTDMFRKLEAQEGEISGLMGLPQALNSHPETAKRIERLQLNWEKLSRKSGFVQLKPIQKQPR
jgi:predicted Zn-dependent protease